MDGTTIDDLHGRLVRDTFGRRLSDADALLVFTLFHTHLVVLSAPVLTDRPGIGEVAAITQRGASAALASAWAGTADERAEPMFWYCRWNGEWGSDAHAEQLPPEEAERFGQLRAELERHPFVNRFEPDD